MGIDAALIEELEAVPTKYFKLLVSSKVDKNDRSTQLANLRTQVLEQLQEAPLLYPPALEQRQMPWYEHAVVPMLGALSGSRQPCEIPVNLCAADGITREFLAVVKTDSVNNALPQLPPSHAVAKWMDAFHEHESASLSACQDPVPEKIEAAFAADPLMARRGLKTAVSIFQTYLAGNAYEHA
jgi:6-phospho-beta-glucosidase